MFKLDLHSGPKWIDLGRGVQFECAAMTTEVRLEAAEVIGPPDEPGATPSQARQVAWAKAVAVQVVLDWTGVGDADGNEIDVSPEGIRAILDDIDFYFAFQTNYLTPALQVAEEGNGSAPSQTGNSEADAPIAGTAKGAAPTARKT
jgi:hypothetical protein